MPPIYDPDKPSIRKPVYRPVRLQGIKMWVAVDMSGHEPYRRKCAYGPFPGDDAAGRWANEHDGAYVLMELCEAYPEGEDI